LAFTTNVAPRAAHSSLSETLFHRLLTALICCSLSTVRALPATAYRLPRAHRAGGVIPAVLGVPEPAGSTGTKPDALRSTTPPAGMAQASHLALRSHEPSSYPFAQGPPCPRLGGLYLTDVFACVRLCGEHRKAGPPRVCDLLELGGLMTTPPPDPKSARSCISS
jgi:hypothetical protein